jgi:hypothetical protein
MVQDLDNGSQASVKAQVFLNASFNKKKKSMTHCNKNFKFLLEEKTICGSHSQARQF